MTEREQDLIDAAREIYGDYLSYGVVLQQDGDGLYGPQSPIEMLAKALKAYDDKSYDVQDVIDAEITLEPMKCRHCGVIGETTYNDQQGDAYCAVCGKWQL